MHSLTKISAATILAALVTGCASGPVQIDPNRSMAGNLARAAEINLADQAVSSAEMPKGSSFAYDTAWNASILNNSSDFSLTSWESLGGGLLLAMMDPGESFEHDSLFGWMPERLATDEDEARLKFLKAYTDAAMAYFEANNIEYLPESDEPGYYLGFSYRGMAVIDDERGCPNLYTGVNEEGARLVDNAGDTDRMCYLVFTVQDPSHVAEIPPQIAGHDEPAYMFTADLGDASTFDVVQPDSASLNATKMMQGISQYLPEWAYMYQAPQPDAYPPMVFDHGHARFFIVPDA